jgi:hypothetical protein
VPNRALFLASCFTPRLVLTRDKRLRHTKQARGEFRTKRKSPHRLPLAIPSGGKSPRCNVLVSALLKPRVPENQGNPFNTRVQLEKRKLIRMKNTLPSRFKRLFSVAEDWIKGCILYQAAINLMHFNEPVIAIARTIAKTKDDVYQAAKGLKAAASTAHSDKTVEARALVTVCRDVLKPRLGQRWSAAWAGAGFTTSLAVPKSSDDLLPLLESLQTYFAANPTHEVADLGATAEAAGTLHGQLSAARTTANACDADVALKKAERDVALTGLRNCGRGLLAELKTLLPGDDGRWRAFGFNPPSAVGLPDVPEGLEVIGSMPQHLFATWESAALAHRYRLYRQIVGVDADFVLVKTVTETESDLNTFTSGQIVRVRVTAVNDAGESLMSEMVEVTVP